MPPNTLLGFLLFLWLVTPGFFFSWLAARRRALQATSTFQEVSSVVLASAAFSTVAAALVLGCVAALDTSTFDVESAITEGASYLRQKWTVVIGAAVAHLVLACLLAWGADAYLKKLQEDAAGRPAPKLKAESSWTPPLGLVQPGTSRHVWLRLRSGVELRGRVKGFGHEIDLADRELILTMPLEYRTADGRLHQLRWQYLIVQGADIEILAVKYIRDSPQAAAIN